MFDDILEAARRYRSSSHDPGVQGVAALGLAVVTCMDSRIDPLALLGLRVGQAKIIRNAGGRVTDDVLRSLVLATNLLGVYRLCVIQHTLCALAGVTNDELRARIGAVRREDATGWDFMATSDQLEALHHDIEVIRSCPLLPGDLVASAFIFDVSTGELLPVTAPTKVPNSAVPGSVSSAIDVAPNLCSEES